MTQPKIGDYFVPKKSKRTIQKYESGEIKIPSQVVDQMLVLEKDTLRKNKKPIAMDVSDLNTLSIEAMINFCFENTENEEEFKDNPTIKLLLQVVRLEGEATGKQWLIFKNLGKGS